MDKQTKLKIIQSVHRRDELLENLKENSIELTDEEVIKTINEIKRLNKILKHLNENENEQDSAQR